MENKPSGGLSVRSGAVIWLVCILIGATALTTNLVPYRLHKLFAAACTAETTGTVFQVMDPTYDGVMYYGPVVEYFHSQKNQIVHAEAVSTIQSSKTWNVGDKVRVAYDPLSPGDIYILEDIEAVKRFKQSIWFAGGMAALGLVFFIVGMIRSIRGTDPGLYERRFLKTPDGKTYNEWLDEQKKEAEAAATEENDGEKT